jgi:hypothetical protein
MQFTTPKAFHGIKDGMRTPSERIVYGGKVLDARASANTSVYAWQTWSTLR